MKKHLLFVPMLASLVLAGCGDKPSQPEVVNPTSITLSDTSFCLIEGESRTVTATVAPDNATDKTVTWSVSEGNEYVTVANGLITAVKAGYAEVIAKTVNNISAKCCVTVASEVIDPTSVEIDTKQATLTVGSTLQLNATVLPENATFKSVSWSVSQGSAVSVSEKGLVTALAIGSAIVKVETVNELVSLCNITVVSGDIDPSGITLSDSQIGLVNGTTKQLTATVLPEDATDKSVTWSVSSGDAVTVDQTGLISAVKVGNAIVTAYTVNGKTASCNVVVTSAVVDPVSVSISDSEVGLVDGTTKQLTATVLPANATDKSVTWSVSSGDAVTVDQNGLVSAVKVGNAVVTVSTVNGKTASCNFTVTSSIVLPTSVTLSEHSLNLDFGGSATLTATVAPNDATDKSVTYSVISGSDVVSVGADTGVVTAIKDGSAQVQVSTVNGKTDVCDITVDVMKLKGYVNDDRHGLIVGNPSESVGGGAYVEVANISETSVPIYNFTYGATVKFALQTVGYFEPTGLKVNGNTISLVDGEVSFVATVEDPLDPYSNFFDIVVLFKDNTPLVGDYEIVTTESTHISLVYTYAVNGQVTKACSQGDKIIITPSSSDPDYDVKAITGYTYNTNEMIQHKAYFTITDNGDGTYYFITPFSHVEIKTIWIEVTEINISAFKGHEAIGEYAVLRTFGSPTNSNVNSIQDTFTASFDASGLISYKSATSSYDAYAYSSENGVLHAMFTTSKIDVVYGKNIMIFGMNSSGGSMVTPLTNGADIAVCVKVVPGMLVSNITFDNHVVKINDKSYATFTFYYAGEIYASCYMDISSKTIETDVSVKKYSCINLSDIKSVYEVFDSKGNSLIHVGYQNEGGEGEYRLITTRQNGYVDDNHSLIFINDDQAVLDGNTFNVSDVGVNQITLAIPTHEYDITLDPTNFTFVITGDREITPKTLDIADKTFTATIYDSWYEKYVDCEVVFGNSNVNITGVIRFDLNAQNVYYWTFTATFDATTDMLTITVTDRGYNGTTCNFDSSIGKTARILVEDGQITFKDHVSTMTSLYDFKNKTFVCEDFHF